jgi:glutathione S-transferase
MIRLLGKAASINVRKVLWTCAELGLAIEHEEWGSGTPRSTQDPAFLALNPNGLVPVLLDGEAVLRESNTLCRYLARRERRDDLLPSDALGCARVELWMDWQATELNAAWRDPFMALVRQSPAHQHPDRVQAGVAQWNRLMGLLDAHLHTSGAFVTGRDFTLADIVLGLSAWRWTQTPIERPRLPAVESWMARLATREAWPRFVANGLP